MNIFFENAAKYKVFANEAEAKAIVSDWDEAEFRINIDPKGSGRCFVEILDEETGEVIGKL